MTDEATGELPVRDLNQAIQLFSEIGAYERHFNQIQSDYRKLASQWLLAAFGAIGLLLYGKDIGHAAGLPPGLIAAGIALAASIGLSLLWHLDVHVYHRLLNACFMAGLCLEQRHTELPRLRHLMKENESTVSGGTNRFYLIAQGVMMAIGLGLIFWYACLRQQPIGQAGALAIRILAGGFALTALSAMWQWLVDRKFRSK